MSLSDRDPHPHSIRAQRAAPQNEVLKSTSDRLEFRYTGKVSEEELPSTPTAHLEPVSESGFSKPGVRTETRGCRTLSLAH